MKTEVKNILESDHWRIRKPADKEDVLKLKQKFKISLPEDYEEILMFSNGGSLQGYKTAFILFSIMEVLALYKEYDLYENIPESLIFGGDGGGTLYCYDLRYEKPSIFFVREDNIGYEKIIYNSPTLTETILKIVNNEKLN